MENNQKNFKSLWNIISLKTGNEVLKSFACECFSGMGNTNNHNMTTADSSLIQIFLNISLPLADRMFYVIKSDDVIDFFEDQEFVNLINIIYVESINIKALFLFTLLNYTNDNFITKEDTIFLFAHISSDANELINSFFGNANSLTQEDYINRLKNNCDFLIFFYVYLWNRKVFDESVLNYYDSVCKTAIMNSNEETLSSKKRNKRNQSLHIKKSFSYLDHGILGIEDGNKKRMLSSVSPYGSPVRKKKQQKDMTKMIDFEFTPSKKLFEVLNKAFNMELVFKEEDNNEENIIMNNGKLDDDLEELNAFENDVRHSINTLRISNLTNNDNQSEYSAISITTNAKSLLYESIITSSPIKKDNNPNTITSTNTKHNLIETTPKQPFSSHLSSSSSSSSSIKQLPNLIEYDQIINDKYDHCKIILVNNFLFVFPYINNTNNTSFSKCLLLTNSFIEYDPKNTIIKLYIGDNILSFNFKHYQADFIIHFNKINSHYKSITNEYTIQNVIGKGQFGNVHLLTKNSNQKTYCVKIITKSRKMTKQIRREVYLAKFLKKHKHKNIVRFDNVIETFNTVYIIMEYVKEGDLSLVNENNKHGQGALLDDYETIMKQLLAAISFLHSFGIIHRDLKLKNILFKDRKELKIKVIDFGLSIILSKSETTKEQCGTFVYTAPEILMKKPYNFKADIWSIGVIGFWFLFQEYPLKTNAQEEITKLHNNFEATWFMKDEEYWKQNFLRRIIRGALIIKQNIRMNLNQLIACLLL